MGRSTTNSITFNGVQGSTKGARLLSVSVVKTGDARGESFEILDMDGELFAPVNTLSCGEIQITLAVLESSISSVKAWLKGEGKLKITGVTPTGRYIKARFVKSPEITPFVMTGSNRIWKLSYTVVTQPYMYLDSGDSPLTTITTSGTTINNTGTAVALPKIEVNGSGDIILIVNGYITQLTGITNGIVLDSTINDAYSIDELTSMNSHVVIDDGNEFPRLDPGNNVVSWTGGSNVSVKITPHWRDA